MDNGFETAVLPALHDRATDIAAVRDPGRIERRAARGGAKPLAHCPHSGEWRDASGRRPAVVEEKWSVSSRRVTEVPVAETHDVEGIRRPVIAKGRGPRTAVGESVNRRSCHAVAGAITG